MKFLIFLVCVAAIFVSPTFGQSPSDENAGSRLEVDSTNQILRFKWWGRAGKTYFLQHSDDLMIWNWVPVVEVGADAVKEYGFTTTGDKFFVRLKIIQTPQEEPSTADSDGDGVSNILELQQGSDPLDYYSRPGGIITPSIAILSGDQQSGLPSTTLEDRLTVKVVDAETGLPLDNAPVTYTPSGGRVSRNVARTGASGRAAISYTAPAEAGTYTILCAAREQGVTFTAHIGLSSTDLRPTAPTGFVSTENPDGSKTLTWIDTSNNEDSFVIWKRDENDNWEELGSVAANETTATITPQGTLAP